MVERLDIQTAEAFCEDHYRHRALIKEAIEREKIARLNQRLSFLGECGGHVDREAEAVKNALKPVDLVRIKDAKGAEGVVWQPDGWLRVCEKANKRFKEFYGADKFESLHQHYDLGIPWLRMSEGKGWRLSVFKKRRRNFLQLLLIFAVQEQLVYIE